MWVVQSNGRQQEPTAPTAARLIGCGGGAAAAAATVGYGVFLPFFVVRNNSLCADSAASREIHSRVRGGTVNDDSVRNYLLTSVD